MSAQEYEWINDAGIVSLRGTPNPAITSSPEGWTQDPTTEEVTVTLTGKPDSVPLTFSPPSGATTDGTNQIVVNDDTGTPVFVVDASGEVTSAPATGSSSVFKDDAGNQGLSVAPAGTYVAHSTDLSFFGTAPVAQQTVTGALSTVTDAAAKDVLTSIIAALAAYGLAVDGTT